MSYEATKLKITKQTMNLNPKMDPSTAPAPVKKLIEAAKEDLIDRICVKQYLADIDESSKY